MNKKFKRHSIDFSAWEWGDFGEAMQPVTVQIAAVLMDDLLEQCNYIFLKPEGPCFDLACEPDDECIIKFSDMNLDLEFWDDTTPEKYAKSMNLEECEKRRIGVFKAIDIFEKWLAQLHSEEVNLTKAIEIARREAKEVP